MSPVTFLSSILDPGLVFLHHLGGPPVTDDARRFLLCVALQEGGPNLDARYQGSPSGSPGPARGRWQFEEGGGVIGVLTHPASGSLAGALCHALTVVPMSAAIWRALEGHDLLACGIARLLVMTDPRPIPTTAPAGWAYYENLWRPGTPRPDVWPANWRTASMAVEPATTV